MGAKTIVPYGSQIAKIVQSAGLFTAHMGRNTTLNRLTGAMPKQADTEETLRKQTSSHYPCRAMPGPGQDDGRRNHVRPAEPGGRQAHHGRRVCRGPWRRHVVRAGQAARQPGALPDQCRRHHEPDPHGPRAAQPGPGHRASLHGPLRRPVHAGAHGRAPGAFTTTSSGRCPWRPTRILPRSWSTR